MTNKVFELLSKEGRIDLESVFYRVGSRPHFIVETLQRMEQDGLIELQGEATLADLADELVTVRQLNGYDDDGKDDQRREFVRHLAEQTEHDFGDTKVKLTFRGARAAYIPFSRIPV